VIAASIIHPSSFSVCVGIEILPGLHEISLQVKEKYEKTARLDLSDSLLQGHSVQFLLGDFFSDLQWLYGDIIFANSTCFNIETMSRLHELASKGLRKGALFVTLSRPLLSSENRSEPFEVVFEGRQAMSWGEADVFLQLKTAS